MWDAGLSPREIRGGEGGALPPDTRVDKMRRCYLRRLDAELNTDFIQRIAGELECYFLNCNLVRRSRKL